MPTERDLPRWLPFVLLIGALGVLFHRLLLGETLFWGLPTLQFYPWRHFAFTELAEGRLPTWNPYLGAGAPLLANYQSGVFYPPNWLWLVLPHVWAMSVTALGHVLWAGLGMWLLTGELRASVFGRALATLSYALGGYLIGRVGSFPTASAVAWLPWLFWQVERVMENVGALPLHPRQGTASPGPRRAALLALIVAAQLLTGHAQTTWYGALMLGAYVGWRLVHMEAGRARTLGALSFGVALGVALAAVQLLPTAEFLAQSQRSAGLDYATLTNLSYHPLRLLTLLSPHFFGTPADGSYLTDGIYFEDVAYFGLVPLLAGMAALWAWGRARRLGVRDPRLADAPFWGGVALVGLALATGAYSGPLYRALYAHVPTFDTFREPERWLILPVFALTVLAARGVDYWRLGPRVVFWSRLTAAGGGGMAAMAALGLALSDVNSEALHVLGRGLIALGIGVAIAALLTLAQPEPSADGRRRVWQVAVLFFVTADLVWAAWGLNPTAPAEFFAPRPAEAEGRVYWFAEHLYRTTFGTDEDDEAAGVPPMEGFFDVCDYRVAVRRLEELRASRLPALNMLDGLAVLNNNDPLLPRYHRAYLDLIEARGEEAGALLQAAGVGTVHGVQPGGWRAVDGNTAEAPYTPRSAWLVREAVFAPDDDAAHAALLAPDWDPARAVVLSGGDLAGATPSAAPTSPAPVRRARRPALRADLARAALPAPTCTRPLPNVIRCETLADAPAYLVLAETWYPGWHAQLDGVPTPLYRANLAFMAVPVPAGEHTVELRYQMRHRRLGAAVSGAALATVLALLAWSTRRKIPAWRKRSQPSQ